MVHNSTPSTDPDSTEQMDPWEFDAEACEVSEKYGGEAVKNLSVRSNI